jgi:signal transduction histidine kinase
MTTQPKLNPQADQLLHRINELELRLSNARAELETSGQLRTLGLLAGAIAHEFNNILTPVLSYARVALDAPGDAELGRRALEKAAEGVERATRLAGSVLNLAGRGSEAGGQHPRCRPEAALRAALESLDRPLAARGIELRTAIEPWIELSIHQTDLEHVLLNLLLNACRAMGDGGGVIEVLCRQATEAECSTWNTGSVDGPLAVLEVRDSGPGLDQALLPTLFEPFQKAAPGRGAARQGHGLGLAICRHLVESAGGAIAARSDPQEGAAFVVLLPHQQEAASRAA